MLSTTQQRWLSFSLNFWGMRKSLRDHLSGLCHWTPPDLGPLAKYFQRCPWLMFDITTRPNMISKVGSVYSLDVLLLWVLGRDWEVGLSPLSASVLWRTRGSRLPIRHLRRERNSWPAQSWRNKNPARCTAAHPPYQEFVVFFVFLIVAF